ncbi:MAG: TauD/TfdA family dioxygenase [Gammaproteobacteria bacterium]|nr:TauD/TfdA family dioxygenase [Gammaproteobacteria bacterium]
MDSVRVQSAAVADLKIQPLSPSIGAELSGVDLREPLESGLRDEIYAALLQWKVVFFRDQALSTDQHLDFARQFGVLEQHPFAPHKRDFPEVLSIRHGEKHPGFENRWHSDVTWRLEPSLGSVLRCLECPDVGGDTLFSDMYAAYEGLPNAVQEQICDLTAIHDFGHFRDRLRQRGATDEDIAAFDAAYPNPEHPVVRTHPETGRRGLYVNAAFTKRIVQLPSAQSDELLAHLYAQAQTPEYQCRFRWTPNAIAFWDNRACQHYAASDYFPARRTMERVTIAGDAPFFSKTVEGNTGQSDALQGHIRLRQRVDNSPSAK